MQTRKSRYMYFGLLSLTTVVLVVACGILFYQNQSITQRNRELIIMNDSIMSANIELKSRAQVLYNKIPRTSAFTGKKKASGSELN